jgi:hypothetical protein
MQFNLVEGDFLPRRPLTAAEVFRISFRPMTTTAKRTIKTAKPAWALGGVRA